MPDSQNLYNSIARNRNLTVGAKALYFYILVGMESEDIKLQTRNKIAYDLNISNQTLGKYLKELTQSGYIKCKQLKNNGRFSSNCYVIQDGAWFYAGT